MNKKCFFLTFSIFLILLFVSCNKDSNRLYLTDFEYSITGQQGDFLPLEDNSFLPKISQLLPYKHGYLWLKSSFIIPENLENEDLSVFLGIIKIADKCYINGKYLGTFGSFPPNTFSSGEVASTYVLPREFLNFGGQENILEIQIWIDIQGKMISSPFISTTDDVNQQTIKTNFVESKGTLIASFFMIAVAAVYFFLYLLRPNEKANISFSRLNFFSFFYLFSLTINEFPRIVPVTTDTYLWYLKIFSGIAGIITGYFAVSFIIDYLGARDLPRQKIHRLSITLIPCVALCLPDTIHDFYWVLGFSYTMLAIHICYAIKVIIIEIKKHNRKIVSLLLGFSPVLVSLLIEVILIAFGIPLIKLIVVLGWQATIMVFLGILFVGFTKMSNEVEFLNNNLEKIVKDRTNELQATNTLLEDTNTHLEFEKRRSQRELDLAAFVQQSFYKKNLPDFKDWEVGYYFKPLSGVSGDLYDFFVENGKLDGFGIFDVSGHGIASGLVTMLVKNIIHQEFYTGTELPLTDVMDIINNRVTEEKGSIENYLTGILSRILSPSKIEIVNAGHPLPVLYKKSTKSAKLLESDNPNACGVIGIPDLPIDYDSKVLTLKHNDSLLLYTDGIIEAKDNSDEEFGTSRLLKSFEKYQDLSINEQINNILNDIKAFLRTDTINDDITILIIRKK